ncbi:MAG: peroxide stress protein YaaA, partial [Firmicutes bacterium]|nr:peroxide stress protein YaaA [Bacillota bacterium]
EQNYERLRNMDLRRVLTPAVLAYEGIQYQYMAPAVFSGEEYEYIQEYLRILSGFYGVLKPFDGVVPYRLEMQAKLGIENSKDLYEFWGSSLAGKLAEETDCILNLASKEYSISISKHLPKDVRFITCVFGEELDGKIVEKGTLCKMARGETVRRMAEQHIEEPEDIKKLQLLNYEYSEKHSDDKTFVFLKK